MIEVGDQAWVIAPGVHQGKTGRVVSLLDCTANLRHPKIEYGIRFIGPDIYWFDQKYVRPPRER